MTSFSSTKNPLTARDKVRISQSLRIEDLKALAGGQIYVLRIPSFVSEQVSAHIAEGLKITGYNDYLNAPQVGRIGMSYFETAQDPKIIDYYFDNALKNLNILRIACQPYACPMDTFRCLVDEVWPEGCLLQTLYGRKMFVGLSRCMKPGIPLKAHHDMFARHAPDAAETVSLINQFAINIYAAVPEKGGEIAIWDDEISDSDFLSRRGSDYAIPLELLPPHDFAVKPETGDLILFNARKLHAVLPGAGVDRITISGFLGYRGDKAPLTVWS